MSQVATRRPTRAGVYVHFPWCLVKCPYCDFVSYVAPGVDHSGYADAVLRELDARAELLEGRDVDSVFFGGGTPSLWEARELGRVLAGVRAALDSTSEIEVTVECNPTSLDEDHARALRDVGVDRVSIGVQSLNDERLRFLGRLHEASGALSAIASAIRAGVPRVSADLIFGLPGQTAPEACAEAVKLADLGLAHLSCYQLTIESGTRFGELARRGRLPLADDGVVAEAFLAIDDALTGRGLCHYEVSNYARPGEESRHNLGYWRGNEYLGLGCAAYGFVRIPRPPGAPAQGVRWRNAVLPERYVEATRSIETNAERTSAFSSWGVWGERMEERISPQNLELLDAQTLLRERIMLGLRISDGLDVDEAGQDLGAPGWTPERERAADWLAERGRIVRRGARVSVPAGEAWLWTDDTAARLF